MLVGLTYRVCTINLIAILKCELVLESIVLEGWQIGISQENEMVYMLKVDWFKRYDWYNTILFRLKEI